MANEIIGAKSYLHIGEETTWGSNGTNKFLLPVDDYGVQLQVDAPRQAKPYLGLFQRKHSRRHRGMPQGSLVTSLYGYFPTPQTGTTSAMSESIAETLLDWCMVDEAGTIHETTTLPSKTLDWAEGPNVSNMRHLGMRVNSATLEGVNAAQPLRLSLDLMGYNETALVTATTIPNDTEDLTEMDFEDMIFGIDDGAAGTVTLTVLDSFSLSVTYSLIVKYNGQTRPNLILKGDREVRLRVTLDKNANTYDAFKRIMGGADNETDFVMQFKFVGYNNGTGASDYTIGTLDIPKARYINHTDSRDRDNIFQQPLEFILLKPDTSSSDMSIAWTVASAKPTDVS